MSTRPTDNSRITRVLKMLDPMEKGGKLAIEFEAGSRAATIVVSTDANGRHSLSFRDRPPPPSQLECRQDAKVLPMSASDCLDISAGTRKIHRPKPGEIEALHARCDAIVRRSMKLLALSGRAL